MAEKKTGTPAPTRSMQARDMDPPVANAVRIAAVTKQTTNGQIINRLWRLRDRIDTLSRTKQTFTAADLADVLKWADLDGVPSETKGG